MDKETLLPCPFCGCETILIQDLGDGLFWAICQRCGAKSGILESHKRVKKAWNRRAKDD